MRHTVKRELWVIALFVAISAKCLAGQFVEVNVEFESLDLGNFIFQRPEKLALSAHNPSFHDLGAIRCVFGTNTWFLEKHEESHIESDWFNTTNIVQHIVVTKNASPESPPVGTKITWIHDSIDGNPGQPPRVADVLGPYQKICWLAFCTGSFLKLEGRHIPPASDLWKEYFTEDFFPDRTTVFDDSLGLPRSVAIMGETNQPLFVYQVNASTNFMGWNLPMEFSVAQYCRFGTNGWQMIYEVNGKVVSVKPGMQPDVPTEVFKYVQRY
jgi:hypothetical protein